MPEYFAGLATEAADLRTSSLDTLSSEELVRTFHAFDLEATYAVEHALPAIAQAIDAIAERMRAGGRLFYIGAGTSGRLGVLDASECPPTFGVNETHVQGVIAGGDRALRSAIEGAEDDDQAAARDLAERGFSVGDALVAISASGTAPYCIGGLRWARELRTGGALTIAMTCNKGGRISREADIAIEMPTGAEALAGSTRLKAGTATKMALNMLSTGVMVRLGKVYQNLMVDVRASNVKLRDRVVRIVTQATGINREDAETLLERCGGEPKTAITAYETKQPPESCRAALADCGGILSEAIGKLRRC